MEKINACAAKAVKCSWKNTTNIGVVGCALANPTDSYGNPCMFKRTIWTVTEEESNKLKQVKEEMI